MTRITPRPCRLLHPLQAQAKGLVMGSDEAPKPTCVGERELCTCLCDNQRCVTR